MYCNYVLISTKDFNPFYVGKTSLNRLNNRKSEHTYKSKEKNNFIANKIKKILREGYDFEIIPTKFYLTEEEAYNDEENIKQYYIDRGYKLCNTVDGGGGLRNPSKELREKMAINASKRFSGDGNPSKRPEVKKMRSDFFKKNNPMKNEITKKKATESVRKSCAKKVVQLSLDDNYINIFMSIRDASKQLNIGKEGISRCCLGRLPTSGGYKWKYMNDYHNLGGY